MVSVLVKKQRIQGSRLQPQPTPGVGYILRKFSMLGSTKMGFNLEKLVKMHRIDLLPNFSRKRAKTWIFKFLILDSLLVISEEVVQRISNTFEDKVTIRSS